MYCRQSGPIYGEASASVRWEKTITPWLCSEGFEQGENECCSFYHPKRDLLTLLYVDDLYEDGEEEDIQWASDRIEDRFDCKDTQWLIPYTPLDYLGMDILLDETHTYLSMYTYINNTVEMLGFDKVRTVTIPIDRPIDGDSKPLTAQGKRKFMTAVGCLGWLVSMARPDCAYAHSRISQHMSSPNESAMEAVTRCFAYLMGIAEYCLAAPLNASDTDLSNSNITQQTDQDSESWRFFCDSDFAGNGEPQNKGRSRSGLIATINSTTVDWYSKVSSVSFAHPDIGEAHADNSSGTAEIHGASNATHQILHLSYVADEMGVRFPKPAVLQMDNSTAEAFANNSVVRSRLKHIDVRQEWVHILRGKSLIKPTHVSTRDNLADMFTKILMPQDFIRLRNSIMRVLPPALLKVLIKE